MVIGITESPGYKLEMSQSSKQRTLNIWEAFQERMKNATSKSEQTLSKVIKNGKKH